MIKIYSYFTGPIQVNTYLVFDETKKGFIVDPGGYSNKLIDKVKEEGVDIEYFILTHGHGDHIGGIEVFSKLYQNAKVVAYEGERELLLDGRLNSSIEICGKPIEIDADIYVKDGEKMTIGNTEYTFVHTPGHTKGGMCILTDGYCFSGDTLFQASIGRTDFYGGSFEEIKKSIREKLFVLPDDTIVLPGHMGQTTIGFEKEHNPFVHN